MKKLHETLEIFTSPIFTCTIFNFGQISMFLFIPETLGRLKLARNLEGKKYCIAMTGDLEFLNL